MGGVQSAEKNLQEEGLWLVPFLVMFTVQAEIRGECDLYACRPRFHDFSVWV